MRMTASYRRMSLLGEAIIKNVCPPREAEKSKFTHDRWHRASQTLEGDSQVGIMLFIGVGNEFGYAKKDILDFLSIEKEEYDYKLAKYKEKTSMETRLATKAKLVRNYVRLHSK